MINGRKLRYEFYELFDAGNVDAEGNVLDPESPRAHQSRVTSPFPSPLILDTYMRSRQNRR